jgi:rsbT co-antagonist protein RsbR
MHPARNESLLRDILDKYEDELVDSWIAGQLAATVTGRDRMVDAERRDKTRRFLAALRSAVRSDHLSDISSTEWLGVRDLLQDLSRSRAAQGSSPSETATFVFSLREPLLERFQREYGSQVDHAEARRLVGKLVDDLGLYTIEVFQKSREEIIMRQQQEMLELSTPVVKLHDQILALPLIGTLDSGRTQVVMENLLQRIVETGAQIAIIDITGVPTVDTLVAQHLLKAVAAARLMGADCIISGIRPQIAQTIVHLGVELADVATKATMATAFALALNRLGYGIRRLTAADQAAKKAAQAIAAGDER